MRKPPWALDAVSAFRRLIASIEFALSAVPLEEEEESQKPFARRSAEICRHLKPHQQEIMIEFLKEFGKALLEAADNTRQGRNTDRTFNLDDIEDPEIRSAVVITITELTDEASWSSADQFHISAAAIDIVSAFENIFNGAAASVLCTKT